MRRSFGAAVLAALCTVATASAATKSAVADAAMNGDTTAVQKLLAQKADVNAPQVDGGTALH